MITGDQTAVTNREYGITQFCKQLCEEGEIRHLLAFVRNESGVLAESYGGVNIKNASLQYYIAYYQDGEFV